MPPWWTFSHHGIQSSSANSLRRKIQKAVDVGSLSYPNLRFSGSGEVTEAHMAALAEVSRRGIRLWGFTRSLRLAGRLREIGASVIVSCDATSPPRLSEEARREGFPLAYSSSGVADAPPDGTLVTFAPVHRIGRVREVVDAPSLCPKVLTDFFEDHRPEGFCQRFCQRCHLGGQS